MSPVGCMTGPRSAAPKDWMEPLELMHSIRPVYRIALAAATVASMLAGYFWLGRDGVLLVAIAWALWLVARYDNWTGSCLMLAILLLLVIAILSLLVVLLAIRP